jgi:glycosyltransferase involved in cell wall biosynthesis
VTDQCDEEAPLLSVVIPCRNGETYLGRQLDALVSQKASFPWELVLVDNGSTDRSMQIAQKYATRLRLTIVSAPDRANQAYARNVGAKAARAEKLVFTDADDEVAPGYLSSMFATLEDNDFVTSIPDFVTLNPEWTINAHDLPMSTCGKFSPYALGSAIGLSRKAFESVGGCPEEYAACEDMAFTYRLRQEGFALSFVPERLRVRFRTTIGGLFHQTRVWGYHQALVYREFRDPFVRRRPMSMVLSEWVLALRDLVAARSKADLARCAVRWGYSVGRLQGSVRHRVFYL